MESKENSNNSFMVKNKLDKINSTSLPIGYRFTNFRPGDENNWAYIQYKAGIFKDYQIAIRTIFKVAKSFGNGFGEVCLFLENEVGERIGTIMILPSSSEDDVQQIKYLALNPKWQGQGLGKVLMSKAYKVINDMDGANRINLEISGDKAKGFFESLGFEKLVQENI